MPIAGAADPSRYLAAITAMAARAANKKSARLDTPRPRLNVIKIRLLDGVEFIVAIDDLSLDEVLARCRLALVFFSGRHCAVCINFEKMLKAICRGYTGICCVKIESERALRHVKQLGILGVPSVVGYVDGRPVAMASGLLHAPSVNMLITSLMKAAYG